MAVCAYPEGCAQRQLASANSACVRALVKRFVLAIGGVLAAASLAAMIVNGSAFGSVATATGNCGLSAAAFCETFDAPAGIGNRSGELNGSLWGVSHVSGDDNIGNPANGWGLANMMMCGKPQTVGPMNYVFMCNGRLMEGQDDDTGVTSLSMYPKQPFDFAGRTGKVTFDVSNDAQGGHAAWPEFWMSDRPVPAPFAHLASLHSLPQDGFGVRFSGFANANGQGASCPEGSPAYVGVASALTVTNYVENDLDNGGNLQLHGIDCIKASTGIGQMNHYEIDISQNQIDIYGTDAGTITPLKHLATIANANLNFTRGLIWLGDAHYNGNKFNTQGTHAFSWDNVGFDGPVLPRDLAYDVNDSLTSAGQTDPNTGLPVVNTGWPVQPNTSHTFTVNNVANPNSGTGALLTFGFWSAATPPFNLNYSINGHAHTLAWPYPDKESLTPKTLAIPLNLSEVQAGSNTLTIGAPVAMNIFNIDLVLVGAAGIVQPAGGTGPTSTATAASSTTPTPAGTAS